MTTLVGLVDRPIPEDSADHTLGYTRSEWLRGEDIVGARIDFEHGRGELKQDDRPLGHVTRTFISNEADGDWLAVEGQLIRQDPLVDALRSHTKKHGMGLSIRYNTRINGQNVITGKQCKEISLHRRPHHAGAIVTVCQGKDDPTGSTAEIQQSIQHLRFPDTKTLPPDSSTVPHFHLPKSLPSSRMATPATAMDTTLPPPAGTPPPANPPAAAEKTTQEPAKSDAVARAEMAIQLAEIQKQNALLQQQVAEANAKRQADEKAAQDKAAKEQTERTDKRRTDFMAAKDHHSALGINMEDPATKALWESVFTQDTGAGIYNAMMTAFKERETLMKTNADTQEKLKSTSQALDVYEKRLKPNNYVPNGQQALPSNASELAERAKNDPAIQNMKAHIDARTSGMHPVTMDLTRKPLFQLPTSLPASIAPGRQTASNTPASAVSTAQQAQRELEVAQGAKDSTSHTGDFIQTKGGPIYVEPSTDNKVARWNQAFSQGGDYIVTGTGQVHSIKDMGFLMTEGTLRGLQSAHLNAGCGWSMAPANPAPKGQVNNAKRVIQTQGEHPTY